MAALDRVGWIFLFSAIYASAAIASEDFGEFTVLHSPNYVNFLHASDPIDASEIPSLVAAYLGLPMNTDIKWKGLAEGSPFKRPKAAVILSISGLPHGKLKIPHKNKYPLLESVDNFDSDVLINHIQSLDWRKEPAFVDFSIDMSVVGVKSQRPDLFSDLPSTLGIVYEDGIAHKKWFKTVDLGSLNITNDPDLQLAAELSVISEIMNVLKLNPKFMESHSPDTYVFKVDGLGALVDSYGGRSAQVKDALRLLKAVIEQLTRDFRDLYRDNCVVQMVGFLPMTEERRQARKGRSLLSEENQSNKTSLNLAPEFSAMYPVIFNIILWTMIALALAIFAIAWGIWNMDPGRDSLIYRMSSQRKKND